MTQQNKWWEIEWQELSKCINPNCDNNGTIPNCVIGEDGEESWEPQQCEYCYVKRFPLKELILKIESQTIKNCAEKVRNRKINITPYVPGKTFYVGIGASDKNKVHDQALEDAANSLLK